MRGQDIKGKTYQLPLGFLLPIDRPGELLVLTPNDRFSLTISLAYLPDHFLDVDLVQREGEQYRAEREEEKAG